MADFDLFVIGGGSGGVACARRAGAYGAKVALCEPSRVGGTCVIRGCIPKKLMRYGATFADHLEAAPAYGWRLAAPAHDWRALIEARNTEIARLNGVYRRMLDDAGVTVMDGRGRVVASGAVEVNGESYTAKRILVAVGARPNVPALPGLELAITSDDALEHMEDRPGHVLVVGGGYIGVELATIFHALGVETTLVIRRTEPLRGFDRDVRAAATAEMKRRGLDIRSSTTVHHLERAGGRLVLHTTAGPIPADTVLYATGREPIPNTREPRARGARRAHGPVRRDLRRSGVPEQRARHLRRRRLQRPCRGGAGLRQLRSHACGDRRRPRDRGDPVQRQPACGQLRHGPDRGVRHTRDRRRSG